MTLDEFARAAGAVPFLDRGRSYAGWDCWGLIVCAFRDVAGLALPDYGELYSDALDAGQVAGAIASRPIEAWRRIPAGEIAGLDVVLMNCRGQPVHIGLALDRRNMLHAFKGAGTVRERIFHPLAPGRVEGIYRYAA